MSLYIQDPELQATISLHESLLDACRVAIRGGGAFAFVTREGAELFLRDEIFKTFAIRGTFNLIVGIDEITNVRALQTLSEIVLELTNLRVQVFYHDYSQTTFHPKFCWFRHRSGGVLITGSGNLTAKGLRGNWEAFTVNSLNFGEIDALEHLWTNWINLHNNLLRELDDPEILERARRNIRRSTRRGRRTADGRRRRSEAAVDVDNFELPQHSTTVLVAEIPRASTRWNQANFNRENFEDFFGMQIGNSQLRAILQHVDDNGELGVMESRQGVSVKSMNYRLELQAAAGLSYPTAGRPIAVFVRVATRTFRYKLLMPHDRHYAVVSIFLDNNWVGPSNRVRRVITSTDELKRVWPDSPLWSDV